jgi:hypothetical protein
VLRLRLIIAPAARDGRPELLPVWRTRLMLNGLLKRRRQQKKAVVYASVDGNRKLRGYVYCAALDVRRAAVGTTDPRALELMAMGLENLKALAHDLGEPAESNEIGGWARDLQEAADQLRSQRRQGLQGVQGVQGLQGRQGLGEAA